MNFGRCGEIIHTMFLLKQRKEHLMKNANEMNYENLTIRNKFMFGKVTQNPVIAQKMAELLTPAEIGEVTGVEREKFLQHRSTSKYVKLDMYLEDENGHVVDTEMQNRSNNKMVQEELPHQILSGYDRSGNPIEWN